MQRLLYILFFGLFSIYFTGCSENKPVKIDKPKVDSKESLIKANQYLVRTESEEIDNFINRRKWDMKETGTGLRYQIYENGSGELAKTGQVIALNYELRLISGDLVYSSEKDGVKSFTIGYGGVESGLEEAVLFLKKGDKARIIIPSHLGYGLLGDQKRISSRSTLIYDINVINILE